MKITIKDDKSLLIEGRVAVGESVPVVVDGVTSTDGLVLRFRHNGSDVARFPLEDGETWGLSGTEASCTLALNTVEARSVFSGLDDMAYEQFVVVLENATTLHCIGYTMLKNWPATEGDQVPYDLADWPNEVDALDSRIANLLQAVTSHLSDASAHAALFAGKADDAEFQQHIQAVNPHGLGVSDIGAASAVDFDTHKTAQNAHSALFAAKASASDLAAHVSGQTKSHVTIESDIASAMDSISSHSHTGSGSVKVNHSDTLGSGSKTHAQLEEALLGIQEKLNQVDGALNSLTSTSSERFESIAAACDNAKSMPNTNDTLRKQQFTAAMTGIASASRS